MYLRQVGSHIALNRFKLKILLHVKEKKNKIISKNKIIILNTGNIPNSILPFP